MSRALVIGGTGVVGSAVARSLLAHGWIVELIGRDPTHLPGDLADAGACFSSIDRSDGPQLRRVVGEGVDLLVDCLCSKTSNAVDLSSGSYAQ